MRKIAEGEVYKTITVENKVFNVIYGYSDEAERINNEPQPIFPDFLENPEYTDDGKPFVMAYQDVCEYYEPKPEISGENWCNDCIWFKSQKEGIGICHCNERRNI